MGMIQPSFMRLQNINTVSTWETTLERGNGKKGNGKPPLILICL